MSEEILHLIQSGAVSLENITPEGKEHAAEEAEADLDDLDYEASALDRERDDLLHIMDMHPSYNTAARRARLARLDHKIEKRIKKMKDLKKLLHLLRNRPLPSRIEGRKGSKKKNKNKKSGRRVSKKSNSSSQSSSSSSSSKKRKTPKKRHGTRKR
jgi:hypothetical protein